jgi:hypothetical protein
MNQATYTIAEILKIDLMTARKVQTQMGIGESNRRTGGVTIFTALPARHHCTSGMVHAQVMSPCLLRCPHKLGKFYIPPKAHDSSNRMDSQYDHPARDLPLPRHRAQMCSVFPFAPPRFTQDFTTPRSVILISPNGLSDPGVQAASCQDFAILERVLCGCRRSVFS